MTPVFLSRKQASTYIEKQYGVSCAPQTLAKFASIGGGPRFQKFGHRPVYVQADLDLWVLERTSQPVSNFGAPEAVTPQFILDMGGDPLAPYWMNEGRPDEVYGGDVDIE